MHSFHVSFPHFFSNSSFTSLPVCELNCAMNCIEWAQIGRILPMTNMQSLKLTLAGLGRKLVSGTSWLLAHFFGRFEWQSPTWITWSRRQGTRTWRYFAVDPKRSVILALTALALGGGVLWYVNRPKPHYVTYGVTPPALTEYNEK